MSIKRCMAPAENVPRTCANCRHRSEKSTFKRCVDCLAKATTINLFPMHETDEIETES